jgi:DNA ligase-1
VVIKDKLQHVNVAKSLYPDVWVSPEIVCEIRADDITKSPVHVAGKNGDALGFALRFPRFVKYRPDKSPTDTTSSLELARLYEMQYQ